MPVAKKKQNICVLNCFLVIIFFYLFYYVFIKTFHPKSGGGLSPAHDLPF